MDSMRITHHEFWAAAHGMIAGAIYLLAFTGGFAGLWSLRKSTLTEQGLRSRLRRLLAGLWIMAAVSWITVITGTYIVYPWYRAKTPDSPRSQLLADATKAGWHTFGMEWKEHVAWLAPILATAVAVIVMRYGREMTVRDDLRKATMVMYSGAFVAAAVAGLFGAFITKVAPLI